MAIKNKDGSEFQLRGPNPAMDEQELWTNFQGHNLQWADQTAKDERELIKPVVLPKPRDFLQELEATKPVETTPEPVIHVEEEETIELPKGVTTVSVHCLPATIRVRSDPLYGETVKTIQYGKPFLLQAVEVDKSSDLRQVFWTTESRAAEGSVLYPQTEEKRWWRVKHREEKTGGWLLSCIISDYQPAFV